MQDLVREAMEAGAIGVSTALIYPPAVYATTEEIAALAKVAGEHGGRYYTHMRNEGDQLWRRSTRPWRSAATAGTPVHIFHLKTAGRQNWGKMPLAIAKIKAARAAGEQVTADIYPYVNNGLGIAALIHPRHFAEGRTNSLRRSWTMRPLRDQIRKEMETTGGWENWYRHVGHDWNKVVIGQASDERYPARRQERGRRLLKRVAKTRGTRSFNSSAPAPSPAREHDRGEQDPGDAAAVRLVLHRRGPGGRRAYRFAPAGLGSFPRLLSRYVRDLGAIRWSERWLRRARPRRITYWLSTAVGLPKDWPRTSSCLTTNSSRIGPRLLSRTSCPRGCGLCWSTARSC
jgi:N-acyl-D-amino-acid deacylase